MLSLTDNQFTAVVGFVAALLAAAVAFFAAVLTNRVNAGSAAAMRAHELELRRQDLTRSKGEELYTLLQTWINNLHSYYIVKSGVMSSDLTYNQGLDLEIKRSEASKGDFVRIEMLIDVYFPELRLSYDKVIAYRDDTNEVINLHKERYKVGDTNGIQYLPLLKSQQLKIDDAIAELNKVLLAKIRSA